MKKLFAILMALAMVLSFAACGETPEEPSDPEAPEEPGETEATGSVYWLNFKPESDEVLKELAAKYTAETGVEVKIETAASGTYNETLTAEMDKSEAPTIFIVKNPADVETWGDYCLDLTGTAIEAELNTDAYKLYDAEGKLCSIGYCYECYGIIVNNALLNEAGYDVSEITNFESLKAIAEDITARSAELGFGAFTSNAMDASSSWRYTGHMINLEYYYEYVDDTAAWAEGTAAAPALTGKYMDNFKALYDLAVVNSIVDRKELANGGLDAQAEFAEGNAVFYVQGSC